MMFILELHIKMGWKDGEGIVVVEAEGNVGEWRGEVEEGLVEVCSEGDVGDGGGKGGDWLVELVSEVKAS